MERSMVRGKPYQQIVLFTIPLLIGNLFQQFYNMADAFIISRTLGVAAFAGVSGTGGLSFLVIGFTQGLTSGLAVVVSQHFGAGDGACVKKSYAHNIVISVAAALLLTALSLGGLRFMLALLRTPIDIQSYAYDYLRIIFMGTTATMMFNFFANSMRALGDSRTPLIYLMIASALNIALDYVLIRYFHMGVGGAAWATVLSQGFSAFLCSRAIKKRMPILSLRGYNGGIQKAALLKNLAVGLPIAFQSSIIALGTVIMQFAINGMGTLAVAAYAAAAKIDGIAVEPLRSLGMAMATYTAQNYGSKEYKRIFTGVKQSIGMSVALSILLSLLMIFGGRWLTAIFVGNAETEILSMSHTFLIIHGSSYIILALLFIFRFTLQGFGKTFVPAVAGAMELIMRIISAVLFVPVFEFIGASIATPLSWFGALVPVAIAYFITVKDVKAGDTTLKSAPYDSEILISD